MAFVYLTHVFIGIRTAFEEIVHFAGFGSWHFVATNRTEFRRRTRRHQTNTENDAANGSLAGRLSIVYNNIIAYQYANRARGNNREIINKPN